MIEEHDPDGIPFSEKGCKADAGKIRLSLLKRFGLALMAVGDLATSGADKYTDHGWAAVEGGTDRYDSALLRHIMKEMFEEVDPDMNQHHAVSQAWNALARLQLLIEKDDQWKRQLMQGKATEIPS